MWTSFKAIYLKKGPLDRLAELSSTMGELFQWKSSHFEDIPWIIFDSTTISEALNIYYWNESQVTEKPLKKKGKKLFTEEEQRPKQPKITRGIVISFQ